MKAAIALLLILALGLGGALFVRHNKAVKEQADANSRITALDQKLNETSASRDEAQKMILHYESLVKSRGEELYLASNSLTQVKADLAKTQQEAAAAAEAAKAEMAKRDSRISELNAQLDDQTKKMVDLNTAIEGLSKMISETERKLSASEGDRSFLLKELRRMQAEKADLERQFNDLAVLKAQVSKLKEDLSIARRLEWIRMGIYGQQSQKGAEKLLNSANQSIAAKSNFNLNVELRQDSGAVVVPPKTNAPAPPKK